VILARPALDKDGHKKWKPPVSDRPTLTLYARVGKGEVALGRWPTTIGGWKMIEKSDGSMALKYNVAAGTWCPPSPPETWDPPSWRDATLGGGVKGKLALLVVGDDPGHLLRVWRSWPIRGGSRVPGDLVEMAPLATGGDIPGERSTR
jgi:hypothetical protein